MRAHSRSSGLRTQMFLTFRTTAAKLLAQAQPQAPRHRQSARPSSSATAQLPSPRFVSLDRLQVCATLLRCLRIYLVTTCVFFLRGGIVRGYERTRCSLIIPCPLLSFFLLHRDPHSASHASSPTRPISERPGALPKPSVCTATPATEYSAEQSGCPPAVPGLAALFSVFIVAAIR